MMINEWINRQVKLPKEESFFLFGPRQSGKSSLVESRYQRNVWIVDLLLTDLFIQYSKDPSRFRKEALQKINQEGIRTVFVDEIQRVPLLLNEIQFLMGHTSAQFILTGSSARKLKRGGANLLAGRAVQKYLFPLTYQETKQKFSLEDVLLYGSLPPVFSKPHQAKIEILSTYVNTYLREEIQNEGIVRNLGGFSRFLDLAAGQSGELVSFSAISRECGLPVRTVQSYYEILADTLIGFRLESWRKSLRKRLIGHPKFYLFDLGVINAVNRRLTAELNPELKGRLFEHFIILETFRYIHYSESEARIFFWRTNHGAEVDLLIEKHGKLVGAYEIKSAMNISGAHLSGLRTFHEAHPETPRFIISTCENAFELEGVKIVPWKTYLESLDSFV